MIKTMLITLKNLPLIRKKFPDKRVVLVRGTFDLIHPGHIDHLLYAKSLGDILVVSVSNDKWIREHKGPDRPIQSQKSRAKIVDAFACVDYTLIAPQSTNSEKYPTGRTMRLLRPSTFVTRDRRWEKYLNILAECGTDLVLDPHPKKESTSRIIKGIISKSRY